MKAIILTVAGALALAGANRTDAQIGERKPHDARVERLLDAMELKYIIDDDGDFKLENAFDNGRTQILFVNSNTETYQKMEIREVWSVAHISDGEIPASIMRLMLQDNAQKKLGSWKISKIGGNEAAVFYAQIAAASEQSALASAIRLVSESADEMEDQLTGDDDL